MNVYQIKSCRFVNVTDQIVNSTRVLTYITSAYDEAILWEIAVIFRTFDPISLGYTIHSIKLTLLN